MIPGRAIDPIHRRDDQSTFEQADASRAFAGPRTRPPHVNAGTYVIWKPWSTLTPHPLDASFSSHDVQAHGNFFVFYITSGFSRPRKKLGKQKTTSTLLWSDNNLEYFFPFSLFPKEKTIVMSESFRNGFTDFMFRKIAFCMTLFFSGRTISRTYDSIRRRWLLIAEAVRWSQKCVLDYCATPW